MKGSGADESVLVGRFNGPWGVHGWVRVYSYTRPATAIFDYRPWLVGETGESQEVDEWQQAGPRLVARLSGIDTREAAGALGRQSIHVPRSALPPPAEDEFYWHDLIGLEVVNLDGHRHGRVARLLETGAHDVLEIERGEAGKVLIPFVQGEFVQRVDLEAGCITVDWPADWVE